VMDRQSDRLPKQTRCEGMRIKREIQMGASGGGQSIKASGHWPRVHTSPLQRRVCEISVPLASEPPPSARHCAGSLTRASRESLA